MTSFHTSGTGHAWWWRLEETSVVEKNFLEEYGTVARWNGALGVCPFLRSGA